MAISLYDLSVPTFLQTVRAVGVCLDQATRHCAAVGSDPDELVGASLYSDMAPFHFQIEAMRNHAVWGLETLRTGVFAPPALVGAIPFAELRSMVAQAATALEALTPDEVNSWSGKRLGVEVFQPVDEDNATTSSWGPRTLTFTPEVYLLSYSLPNFYFHAVTAYDILRAHGVPIGKYHFQGQLRTR